MNELMKQNLNVLQITYCSMKMCISFSKWDVNLFVYWADYLKVNVKGIVVRYRENGYIGS